MLIVPSEKSSKEGKRSAMLWFQNLLCAVVKEVRIGGACEKIGEDEWRGET